MIFRAIFWIAVVALLMPHEPDLGLGRPGGASLIDRIKQTGIHRLAEVKAELDAADRTRHATGG
jgi:hypothetical protein